MDNKDVKNTDVKNTDTKNTEAAKRRKRTAIIVLAVLAVIVAFRIVTNIIRENERAERIAAGSDVSVSVGYPSRRTIIPRMEFSGTLDPEWQAEVGSKVDGRLEKVFVREGDKVTKGQVLAILEQEDTSADLLNAQGSFMDAETNLRKAQSDLVRYQELYERGAVSEQTVDDYRFARDNAIAKLEAARGNLQGMESKSAATTVVAPADGIIYKRYYQEGYYAKYGTSLFAIADISMLKTVINIPEGQIEGISVGNEAKIVLPAFSGREIIGHVTRISPVADIPGHTFATEVSVNNTEGLRAGVFATVYMIGNPMENVLTIPPYAIVMRDDQQTVYVVNDEGIVTRRVLTTGYSDENAVQILKGLSESDQIVTSGQNKLREGTKIVQEKDKAGSIK